VTPLSGRPSDNELVSRILAGDTTAMETLMRLHNRTLYRTARAILRDDGEAEDAVQEAYLRAYRALATFRGESKLSTWLVRITANEALMRRRRNSRPAPIEPIEGHADSVEHGEIGFASEPESEAQRSEMRRLLEARIDALPKAYRAVFVLRALEELTVEETAHALEIPQATVRTRYFRARRLLRESMASDVDTSLEGAFAFAGPRCDRIVREVSARLLLASSVHTPLDSESPRGHPIQRSLVAHDAA
jgi:RNA polymerase sigma-70 factor (ECF subfamily)